MGSEGEQQRIVYEMTSVTYVTITMMMQRSEKTFSTYSDNGNNTMMKQGCESTSYTDNDCNYTRVDWRWRALTKADWFVLTKMDGFVLTKTVWLRLDKDGLLRLEKDGLGVFKKNGFRLRI
jgi:hypothetical protein